MYCNPTKYIELQHVYYKYIEYNINTAVHRNDKVMRETLIDLERSYALQFSLFSNVCTETATLYFNLHNKIYKLPK